MPRLAGKQLLALGDDDRGEYRLDLSTGAISTHPRRRWSPMDALTHDEVTPANLARIFEQAFYTTNIDKDGDLTVSTDAGRIMILIGDENRFLRFMALYDIREDADDGAKLALINRMNINSGFARFYMSRPDRLVADCDVPFDRDIPLRHMAETFRQFSCAVWAALKNCDEDELIGG